MNDHQEEKVSMGLGAQIVLRNFNTVYDRIPEFVTLVGAYDDSIDDILSVQVIQELNRSGVTISKANLADSVINTSITFRNAIVSYAELKNDIDLIKNVSYTDSVLKHSRDVELFQRSRVIYNAATPIIAQLQPYGILPADLTAFQTDRLAYLAIIGEPRIATVVRASATKLLVTKFRIFSKLLHRLDNAVPGFIKVNPDFVSQYKGARIIVNTGRRKSGSKNIVLTGTIRHFETLALMPGATVTIVETGQTLVVGSDAFFKFILTEPGIYTLRVDLAGFQTYTEDGISMESGNELNIDIELEPLEV